MSEFHPKRQEDDVTLTPDVQDSTTTAGSWETYRTEWAVLTGDRTGIMSPEELEAITGERLESQK